MASNINISTADATLGSDTTELSAFGKRLHEYCRDFMWPVYNRHSRAYRFYLGDQWRTYRRRGLAMPVFNIVGPHMDVIASNLTDSEITFQCAPKNPEDADMCMIWDELLRQACEQDSFSVRVYGHIVDSLVKGYGVAKIVNDDERAVPVGIDFIDPYNYMGEPGVRRPDINGNYHWHSEWMTAMEVREIYGDKYKKLIYTDPATSHTNIPSEFDSERSGDHAYTRMALIKELYIRTNETEKIPADITKAEIDSEYEELSRAKTPRVVLEQNHNEHLRLHQAQMMEVIDKLGQMITQAVTEGQIPPDEADTVLQDAIAKNPIILLIAKHNEEHEEMLEDNPDGRREKYNGWMRVVYGGENFEVLDGPEATSYVDEEGRGIHPYVIMTTPYTGTDIYSWSVLERCMNLQEMINLWLGKFQDHLSLCSSPMLAIDVTRVSLEPNQMTALAGSIIPTMGNPREVLHWIQPPMFSGQLIQNFYQMMKQIELITGVSDVELGAYPNMERASQPMIRELKEASRARWREYQREFKDFLTRIFRRVMLVIQKNMTEQMQLRMGKTNNEFALLNEIGEDVDGNMTRLNDLSIGQFDIRVMLTPLTSLSPDSKLQRALSLFTATNAQGIAVYDLQAVAEDSEDAIIQKSVERQMQMQQMMMQQQAQQQAEEGGE